jgi:hypothetical protein
MNALSSGAGCVPNVTPGASTAKTPSWGSSHGDAKRREFFESNDARKCARRRIFATKKRHMRYLLSADDGVLCAYAPGRRDFFRASDDTLWAHESHDWLIETGTGKVLAHRTADTYYGVESGERLYREVAEYLEQPPSESASTQRSPKSRRPSARSERRAERR